MRQTNRSRFVASLQLKAAVVKAQEHCAGGQRNRNRPPSYSRA